MMGLNDNYWKEESSITSNRRLLYMDFDFFYVYFFLILLIFIVCCLPCLCANFLKARVDDAESTEEEEEEERGDEESSSAYNLEWNTAMNEHVSNQVLFLTKFRFQTVLPDKSNVNARTIRSTGKNLSKLDNNNDADKDTTESTAAADEEEEDDDDFQITTTTNNNDNNNNNSNNSSSERSKLDLFSYYNNFNSSWGSSSGGSKLDLFSSFSSLRKAVHQNEECCFCLEGYEPGQTICAAASKECNHVFHEECMKNWFYEKKSCPICRTDFLKSSI